MRQLEFIRWLFEYILGILFPPKFPRIKTPQELYESWVYRESPNHHPILDPFSPELRRWESWAGHTKERQLTPEEWKSRRARKLDV